MNPSLKWRITAFAVCVYVAGAAWYLSLFNYVPGRLWGDAGDSFFNLWVLNHIWLALTNPDVSLFHPPIFWPDQHGAFFWSDNLLAVSPIYFFADALMSSRIDAFWLTGILWSAMHFAALCYLFYQVIAWVRDHFPELPPSAFWWVPILAGVTHFTPAVLLNHFTHLQNLTSLGIFVLLGGMFHYARDPGARRLWPVALPLVLMLYSAPYFAVIGIIITLAWAIQQYAADSVRFRLHIWQALGLGLICALLALPLALAYMRYSHEGYLASDVTTFAIRLSELWTPQHGLTHDLLRNLFDDYPGTHHERIAWLGPGLMIALLVMGVRALPKLRRIHWRDLLKHPLLWVCALSLLLIALKVREIRAVIAIYGIVFVGVALVLYLILTGRRYRRRPFALMMAFLAFCVVLLYGFALGPHRYFVGEAVNPSIWGVFALWFPGFTSMRAVGRIAYLGYAVLVVAVTIGAAVWYAREPLAARPYLLALFVAVTLLQVLDPAHDRPPQRVFPPNFVEPRSDEQDFFEPLEGPIVVLPSYPFSRSTRHMLYFQSFPRLHLVNGYSGRSTPRWDAIRRQERSHGIASSALLDELAKTAPVFVAIHTHKPIQILTDPRVNLLFQNDRWQVYAMSVDP